MIFSIISSSLRAISHNELATVPGYGVIESGTKSEVSKHGTWTRPVTPACGLLIHLIAIALIIRKSYSIQLSRPFKLPLLRRIRGPDALPQGALSGSRSQIKSLYTSYRRIR